MVGPAIGIRLRFATIADPRMPVVWAVGSLLLGSPSLLASVCCSMEYAADRSFVGITETSP